MHRIHILDQEMPRAFGRVSSFWYPVYLNRRILKDLGLRFQFFGGLDESISDCDALFLSSRYFHLEGKSYAGKQEILETLAGLRAKAPKIIWFDLRDSSGNTQYEVLPYVDKYLKKQLLGDRAKYRESLHGNRVYTDYFHKNFGITDSYVEECAPLPVEGERKVGVSWNIGMHDNRGGSLLEKALCLLRDQAEVFAGGEHRILWQGCERERDVNMVALFHMDYERETVGFQRRRAAEILGRLQDPGIVTGRRLPRRRYLQVIAGAKLVLSLFGWGEICFRDFETFIAGAALVKPDVSHLETWPDLYVAHHTYWPVRWDLADLAESYERLMGSERIRLDLAQAGQEKYRQVWSREGRQQFCERLKGIVESAPEGQ